MAELVEGTTLLTWQGVKSLEGSNPSLSALMTKEPPDKGGSFVFIFGKPRYPLVHMPVYNLLWYTHSRDHNM